MGFQQNMKSRREYVERLLKESKEKCTFEENEEFLKSSMDERKEVEISQSLSKLDLCDYNTKNLSPEL